MPDSTLCAMDGMKSIYSPDELAAVRFEASKRGLKCSNGVVDGYKKTNQQSTTNKYDDLIKLKSLLDQRAISQEEYDSEKKKILTGK